MEFFLKAAERNNEYLRLCKYLDKHEPLPALVTGLSHIHKAHFIAALLSKAELLPVLVIAESEGEAQKLCLDINAMLGEERALLYPAKELALGNYEAASREYEHKRIYAMSAMLEERCSCVICSPEAAAQLTIPPEELKNRTVSLNVDDDITQDELVQRFISAGYYFS